MKTFEMTVPVEQMDRLQEIMNDAKQTTNQHIENLVKELNVCDGYFLSSRSLTTHR